MTWFEAAPIALAAVAWLVLPGLPVSYALGLRGIAAWAMAPTATVAIVASTAAIAERLGLAWAVWLPIAVCAAVAATVGAVALLLGRRVRVVREPDPRGVTLAAACGLLPAFVIGAATVVRGFGGPENLSQTYDALFHYNALALILDTGRASSLTIGSLGNPGVPATFYPAAWHDLASLLVLSTGTSIPAAANLLSAAIATVVWPLSCLLLVRQIFGCSPAALAITGVLSIGFTAFPWGLLGFGVLWPNALGLALTPAALAVVVSLTGWARDDALGHGRCWLMLPAVLAAAGFSHANVLFGLVVLAVFPAGAALLKRAWWLHRSGQAARGVAEVLGVLVALGAVWYWAATTAALAGIRTQYWAPFETPARAVGEVLLNATNGTGTLWLLSAIVLVGSYSSVQAVELRWLVAAHAATGFLYLITASLNRPDTQKFTGYWYNDSFRLAAMLPITGVPLAAAGVVYLAGVVVRHASRYSRYSRYAADAASRRPGYGVVAVAVAVTLLAFGASGGLYQADRQRRLADSYAIPEPYNLAGPSGQAFLVRIKDRIPEHAVVANNPWDGSALLWALAGRKPLFPHFDAALSPQQGYLAQHLTEAATDPRVCQTARQLVVEYLLIGSSRFWPDDPRRHNYPGLADPQSRLGFELVDTDGVRKLYRIDACAAP